MDRALKLGWGSEAVIRGLKFLPLKFKGSKTALRGLKFLPQRKKGSEISEQKFKGSEKIDIRITLKNTESSSRVKSTPLGGSCWKNYLPQSIL